MRYDENSITHNTMSRIHCHCCHQDYAKKYFNTHLKTKKHQQNEEKEAVLAIRKGGEIKIQMENELQHDIDNQNLHMNGLKRQCEMVEIKHCYGCFCDNKIGRYVVCIDGSADYCEECFKEMVYIEEWGKFFERIPNNYITGYVDDYEPVSFNNIIKINKKYIDLNTFNFNKMTKKEIKKCLSYFGINCPNFESSKKADIIIQIKCLLR